MKRLSLVQPFVVIIVLFCFLFTDEVKGQKILHMIKRTDSLMTARYRRSNIDTAYIIRPNTKWTLKGLFNVSGAQLEMEGMQMGKPFRSKMDAAYKKTFSMGVSYLGLTLSFALNPAKLLGKYNDFELNLNSYSNRWGFDIIYQDAHNFTGWHEVGRESRIDLPAHVLTLQSLNVNAYYAFNNRHFSYPAAFSQTYIQKRSAGSFLLGFSLQGLQAETKNIYESELEVANIGIGAGYGYNWVPNRRWLLHISSLPTFIVSSNTSLTNNEESIPLDYHFPEVIVTVRGAIIRQIGKMFTGLTMVYNYSNIGYCDHLAVYNMKWRTRLIFGYRF